MRVEKYIKQWKQNYILFYAMLYMAICLVLANLMLCSHFMLPVLLIFPLCLCCLFTFSIRNALSWAGCEKEGHEQGIAFYTFLIEHELTRQVTVQRLRCTRCFVLTGKYEDALQMLNSTDISKVKRNTLREYELLFAASCLGDGDSEGYEEHLEEYLLYSSKTYTKEQLLKKKTPEELLACNATIRVSPKSAKVIITLFRIVFLLLYLVCCIVLIILFSSTVRTVKIPNVSIVLFLVALILVILIIIANLRLLFSGDKQYLKVKDRVCCALALLGFLCFVVSVAFTVDYRNEENLKLEKFQSSFFPKEIIPADSIETYYLAIYQYLGNEGTCEFASNAKGEIYAFWEVQMIEEDGQQGVQSHRLVYDRKSANGLATLIVHYGVVEFGEGDQYRKEEKMLDEYAVRDSDKAIFSSGKTSWEMVGGAEYREVTGE